ncbi:leucine-rich repeat-containing G-protein coupled receptor 5A [Culicoides brevitarsis]|uniref:leucine-rich repeat-containing G-protein coupled receptor 5A n=1 Tax=Culicoides brevitarsis TaxID=469753 RepID=UPI00307C796F
MTLSASSNSVDTNSINISTSENPNVSKIHLQKFLTTARPPFLTRNGFHDTIVLPTATDADKEAERLYNEALKEFVAASDGFPLKTMKKECETPWVKQHGCLCSGTVEKLVLNCRATGINNELLLFSTSKFPETLIKLDLGNNNITSLPNRSFNSLKNLEELILSDNNLISINQEAFYKLNRLKRLILHNCNLTTFPLEALQQVPWLNFIQLSGNSITSLVNVSLVPFTNLKSLRLDGNLLEKVPTYALTGLTVLDALNLENNLIASIKDDDFPLMGNLTVLLLKRNRIMEISAGAFKNMGRLKILEIDDNLLTAIPYSIKKLHNLQELSLNNNRIRQILKDDLPKNLIIFEMRGNPITYIEDTALQDMSKLRKLILSDSRTLETLPSMKGCEALEIIRIDRCRLKELPTNLCETSPKLKSLEAKSNMLETVPVLGGCKELRLLDFSGNQIESLHGHLFRGLEMVHDLLLSHNEIHSISEDAFSGLVRLQSLDLESNNIKYIHPNAFTHFLQIEDINLGNNQFPDLPTKGLSKLLHLKTFNNPRLKEFPSPESFPKIQTLVLSYAYHCCPFLPLVSMSASATPTLRDEVYFPSDNNFDYNLWNNTIGDFWPQLKKINLSNKFDPRINDLINTYGSEYGHMSGLPAYTDEYYEEDVRTTPSDQFTGVIHCLPAPGPFLPCQDLFDWWTLRCGVWVVFLLAMLGNGTVVFVLIFSRSKMDVPRFLVCNLAAADFFMGIYLGFLAVVDASTLGEFRRFAIPWQMSVGCQLSGFLAVLSSELSVFTLAVITLERNYAITHAMHLNKRLSLRHAGYIMSIGWIFALIMATLPLFGVSDYRKFAVCLPFETVGNGSLAYVVFLMFINGVAFLILMGCYLKMYCAIRGSQAWNSNDSRIAKRMALLVFTDFLCWSPIAFFSLTAVFGLQLISLEQAKVFTVFILPLNSCCNPFLYAILTKQFKKDCVMICKAIEESRVTRGIGRCRHSSNFSNRHTPANTNSLVERSSRDLIPPLLPGQTCNCAAVKLLEQQHTKRMRMQEEPPSVLEKVWRRIFCQNINKNDNRRRGINDNYAYQIAEIQQKNHKRAGSMSSSENFSSSRSDSWRHGAPHHHCGIPLRLLDPRRRHTSWLITRKTSQDSNLSSSRNDSSGSNTTASTSTWRMSHSRSSASSCASRQSIPGQKPRLVRQQAVNQDDAHLDLSGSISPTGRLNVRFLPTIPSAADSSIQLEEDPEIEKLADSDSYGNGIEITAPKTSKATSTKDGSTQFFAIIKGGGKPQSTLSSLHDNKPP